MKTIRFVTIRRSFIVLAVGLIAATGTLLALAAPQTDIVGPVNSDAFGYQVMVLADGNIVVSDPYYDAPGPVTNTGAVYLYNGATGELISQLTGSSENDFVGLNVITLTNGNYVVYTPYWDNGTVADVGAVTWGNGAMGITGFVSMTNSLVGSTADDQIGRDITTLDNGNYVVHGPYWDNGAAEDAGAATWGNGMTGITGVVSMTNSLVGGAEDDTIGNFVVALSNGNYVVSSEVWDNDLLWNVGAVTWGNGTTGITGVVSIANSLIGGDTYDRVGNDITVLSNGNYVVGSPGWHNGSEAAAGAVTWGNGTTGITGTVSIGNSLVGSQTGDWIGLFITELSNGNYVVHSSTWDNGAVIDAGAATWGNGQTGITGVISITNSLVGSMAYDGVGWDVRALSNGNYVVINPYWDNGAATDAGAATWGSGTMGITGVISITNSLVGNQTGDQVSSGVATLSNGNYVVLSPKWHNGAVIDAGAATWGSGTTGITGVVSLANSLVGSTENDQVGWYGVVALSNGNYVVRIPNWDNGVVTDVGAATWGNGVTGITGTVSAANSLVGSTDYDQVSAGYDDGVTALSNGNYVVLSGFWDNGAMMDAGAATWGNGLTGITGVISITNSLVGSASGNEVGWYARALSNGNYVVLSAGWDNGVATDTGAVTWGNGLTGITGVVSITNSLVGSTMDDKIGIDVTALGDGNYVVRSPYWDNGVALNAGAITWGNGWTGTAGPVTADNSVRGSTVGGGSYLNFKFDYSHNQLVVGRPADNIVTLFSALPHLTLSKSVVPNINVPYHGVVTYTVVLNNADSISDTTALVTDTLPLGVTFGQWLEAPNDVIRNGNAITWTGTLTHGTAITLAFTALHIGDYGEVITNTAYFSGAGQVGSVSAAFSVVPLMHTVTARTRGAGGGIVSSAPAGIDCGAICSAMFIANSPVTLTATPLISSTFTGWSGDVVTTTNPIAFTSDADKSVTATFALKTFVITPTAGVNGQITPNTPQPVNYGASQTFTITADPGYRIADVGVDGVSMGALSTYTFNTITANHTLTATFASDAFTLTVNYAGTGRGSVLLNPPGPGYTAGSVVTLTAAPSSTSIFAGWSGDVVTTTNPLVLIMDTTKSVTATFTTYRVYLPLVLK